MPNQVLIYILPYLHSRLGLDATLLLVDIINIGIRVLSGLAAIQGLLEVGLDLLLFDVWQARLRCDRGGTESALDGRYDRNNRNENED